MLLNAFIALIISTCFGHLYAHHQELETILVLLPRMVCNALVAGGRLLGAEQQTMRPGRIACCSAPNSAYKCPKHVEQIVSAIKSFSSI